MNLRNTEEKKPQESDSPILIQLSDDSFHIAYKDLPEAWKVGGWESCNYCGGQSCVVFDKNISNYTDMYAIKWISLKDIGLDDQNL